MTSHIVVIKEMWLMGRYKFLDDTPALFVWGPRTGRRGITLHLHYRYITQALPSPTV